MPASSPSGGESSGRRANSWCAHAPSRRPPRGPSSSSTRSRTSSIQPRRAVLAFLAGRASAPRRTPSFRPLTFREGFVFSARFLPDGASVVYGASWDGAAARVHVAELSAPEARTLDLPAADVFAVSKKGEL